MSDWLWSGQTFRAWLSGQPEFYEQHPFAHIAGGFVLDFVWGFVIALGARAYGLTAPPPGLLRPALRTVLTGVTQAFWELNQVEEYGRRPDQTPNYPYAFAALDVTASLLGAAVAEAVRLAVS